MGEEIIVLVADDDAAILRLLELHLSANDLRVRTARTGAEVVAAVAAEQPIALIILDSLMPVMDGFEALHHIRALSDVPVIMLTAGTEDAERVQLLRAGADDCLTKPFNPDELTARIGVVLRRCIERQGGDHDRLVYGALMIDLLRRRIERSGKEVRLSATEWALLAMLAHDAGKTLSSRQLLAAVWGPDYVRERLYLHTWISRVRRKLGDDLPLMTIAGVGYRLDVPA